MPNATRQLITLPNISVQGAIDLGNFRLVSSTNVEDFPIKYHRHINTYANMYHTINHPVTDVGILIRTSGRSVLGPLTDSERETITRILDALIFASCYRDRQLMPSRDNYDVTVWEFQGDKAPTKVVNLRSRRFRMQVVENKPHLLQIPQHVNRYQISEQTHDGDVLHALLRCAYSKKGEDEQLMRSLNWFNLAHADTRDLTEHTRFAMTSAAFEALLNTPDGGTTRYFRNAVQMLLGQSKELDKWADRFYYARSRIVHGGDPGDMMFGEHRHNSLLFLADYIFVQCVYAMIGVRRHWPIDSNPTWLIRDVRRLLISNKSRFLTINSFGLRMGEKKAEFARDCLLSIQKNDVSVTTLQECVDTIRSIVSLAHNGLGRISRMTDFRTEVHRQFIVEYRRCFQRILDHVDRGEDLRVYNTFRPITDRVSRGDSAQDEMLAEVAVRGRGFGNARKISLEWLVAALYNVEDIYGDLLHG